jgi:hypothetical protein
LQGSGPRLTATLQNRILPEHQKTAERRDAQPISRATSYCDGFFGRRDWGMAALEGLLLTNVALNWTALLL